MSLPMPRPRTAADDDEIGWPRRPALPRPIESVRRLHDLDDDSTDAAGQGAGAADRAYRLDRHTSDDLDLPLVFGALDRTHTPAGAQRLYQLLHTPRLGPARLEQRELLIQLFERDARARTLVGRQLERMAASGSWDLPDLLWGSVPAPPAPLWLMRLSSVALPVAAVLGFWLPALWLLAIALFAVNNLVEIAMGRVVDGYRGMMGSLARLLAGARGLAALELDGLGDLGSRLRDNVAGTRAIASRVRLLGINDPLEVIGYVRAALLLNVTAFFRLRELIDGQRTQLRVLYKDVGLLDAALAIAGFRRHEDTCRPVLASGDPTIAVRGVRHPAVTDAVGNDLELDRGRSLLVTGSNMAGKTTFLKALGVNAILAQSIGTVAAEAYRAPPLQVMSSVDIADDLRGRRSYYLEEVHAVLQLVEQASASQPCLFILDELFRGTNPVERIAAATEVLEYLARRHTVLAATHDLELCGLLADRFDNAHFEEQVTDSGLAFDYRLRPGPCTTRNAIALLRVVGFPAEIVDRASARIAPATAPAAPTGRDGTGADAAAPAPHTGVGSPS